MVNLSNSKKRQPKFQYVNSHINTNVNKNGTENVNEHVCEQNVSE